MAKALRSPDWVGATWTLYPAQCSGSLEAAERDTHPNYEVSHGGTRATVLKATLLQMVIPGFQARKLAVTMKTGKAVWQAYILWHSEL